MGGYADFAAFYDRLTDDVGYPQRQIYCRIADGAWHEKRHSVRSRLRDGEPDIGAF